MDSKKLGAKCINVFKNKKEINKSLTKLWIETINQLEASKYITGIENLKNTMYNIGVQSCPYQSNDGKVGGI